MEALYVLSGLGIVALVAEILNFKKVLNILVVIGLLVAGWLLVRDWNEASAYFNNMIIITPQSKAIIVLMIAITIFWIWMATDYLQAEGTETDRTSLII